MYIPPIFINLKNNENAQNIAEYGANLGKLLIRPVKLFLSQDLPISNLVSDAAIPVRVDANTLSHIKKNTTSRVKSIVNEVKDIWPHVTYQTTLGFPEVKVANEVEEETPFMVMVEQEKETDIFDTWIGTQSTRLASQLEVPTLIVPTQSKWMPLRRILYIMDLNDHKFENILFLDKILKQTYADLHIIVISESKDDREIKRYSKITQVTSKLLDSKQTRYHHLFTDESTDTVFSLIESIKPDWFCFEHKHSSFVERMFKDYTTNNLILNANIPAIVF